LPFDKLELGDLAFSLAVIAAAVEAFFDQAAGRDQCRHSFLDVGDGHRIALCQLIALV
jgi:hypothetical protein